jgi:hypothetical protein
MKSPKSRDTCIEDQRIHVWGPDYRKLSFPVKLHMLLSCDEFASDVWWVDDGAGKSAFAVDREGYKRHIMSIFFHENKFRSFQTLLHKYGFRTVTSINNTATDIIIYQHAFFVKGNLHLCKKIARARDSNKARRCISPPRSQEPEQHNHARNLKQEVMVEPKRDYCFTWSTPCLLDMWVANCDDCCSLSSEDTVPLMEEFDSML